MIGFATLALSALAAGANVVDTGKTFADDVAFLKQHTDAIVLKSGKAAVAVVPQYQGRVMTSTGDAAKGNGNGFINYAVVESGKIVPHINVFGGEDRFWLGPEGGQFSVFFKGGDPFDLPHWQTPPPFDSEHWKTVAHNDSMAKFHHDMDLTNYWGTEFKVGVDRTIEMIGSSQALSDLGLKAMSGIETVAYRSVNKVTNRGGAAWTHDTGALSVWILGMYKPGDKATIIVPFNKSASGPILNDAYFGKVPAERLKQGDGVMYFRADGKYRSKIGVPPSRVKPFRNVAAVGSFDAAQNLLTVVTFSYKPGVTDYVNSMWEIQEKPFGGDVTNAYNDGPPAPGAKPLGPFFELESSSPAMFLSPGNSWTHVHSTYHFKGSRDKLDQIAKSVLGVSLDKVTKAF